MFNTAPDVLAPATDTSRRLQFDGTVEVEGAFIGQVLNALFGPDSQVNGKLHFEGVVQIDGTFTGSITTSDLLIIGEHAKIAADIVCGSAVVSGEVSGNITARDSVELKAPARIKGDIATPAFGMEKGAVFDGVSKMQGTTANFAALERRGRPRQNQLRSRSEPI
jgi:cytoskeletal protein CcmA (bactofilin family)